MKQTVTESMFIDSFRGGYKDNFSYEGKKALFEWLESLEMEEDTELDPVGLCCEFSEYDSIEDFASEYGSGDIETMEDIEDRTTVIRIDDDSFIIQCY
jgi:hypothetical protein